MEKRKILTFSLCCCVLALSVAVGAVVYLWQRSAEELTAARTELAKAQERNQALENELCQMDAQLVRAREERAEVENERDYAQYRYEIATQSDNPIDQYRYANGRASATTTYEMAIDSWFFCDAWELELEHLVEEMKADRQENPQLEKDWLEDYFWELDHYRATVGELAASIGRLIRLEQDVGYKGSMASVEINSYWSGTYRKGTLDLLGVYSGFLEWQKVYSYAFNDETVTRIREELGDPLAERVPGQQLFPPLSQVLPESP